MYHTYDQNLWKTTAKWHHWHNFTWEIIFTILVCIMHNHPNSNIILPLSVIIFLHWGRIKIINKINGNIWLIIDILQVSPQFHHLIQAFDDMYGKNPIDGVGVLERIIHSNLFINFALWIIDYMCCWNQACSCFIRFFCILHNNVVMVLCQTIDLQFLPTLSTTLFLWGVVEYFHVKGLLYLSAKCRNISTQYLFLNSLEEPSVLSISLTSFMLLISFFIMYFLNKCSINTRMMFLFLYLESVQIRKVCVLPSKKHTAKRRLTLSCVHKALYTSFWYLYTYTAKSLQLHSVLSSYQPT